MPRVAGRCRSLDAPTNTVARPWTGLPSGQRDGFAPTHIPRAYLADDRHGDLQPRRIIDAALTAMIVLAVGVHGDEIVAEETRRLRAGMRGQRLLLREFQLERLLRELSQLLLDLLGIFPWPMEAQAVQRKQQLRSLIRDVTLTRQVETIGFAVNVIDHGACCSQVLSKSPKRQSGDPHTTTRTASRPPLYQDDSALSAPRL